MNKIPFYLAGAGGGALSSLLDLFQHPNQGTISRVGAMLREQFFGEANVLFSPAFWGIILIILVSIFVCWIYETTSRTDGFMRGCTVLAAFSIGAPGPIINQQVGDLEPASWVTELGFISSAYAQAALPSPATGEAFVVLDHLKDLKPRPDSTVTMRNSASGSALAIFTVTDNTIRVAQPYGSYTIEVNTPGFQNIKFDLVLNEPLTAYSVDARPSGVPLALQKLLAPDSVVLKANNAEKYKQEGRKRALLKDFLGAANEYQMSLSLEPHDGITHDYLGYAFFRLGKYTEAAREFEKAIEERPDYKWPPINLIKVDCAQGKFDEARQKFNFVRTVTGLWKSDVEFTNLCAPLLDH